MGLIKAALGAGGSVLADQWKEFFYCDALDMDVLVKKGQKRIGNRSSNTKASDNIISNGSGIAVADGQCMIIVEQGKVVEVCAEPGEFTYDSSTEPSIFSGSLGQSIIQSFKAFGKRFAYGGDTGKDQRVYYFNTKEIMGNKFGTPTPIMFEVKNKEMGLSRTVNVRCNGMYSYILKDPLLFYTRVCGNVTDEYRRSEIDEQLKSEFIDALTPAFGILSELELKPAQLSGKTKELKDAMNEALKSEWIETRGISIEKITLNPLSLTPEDMKKINEFEESVSYGGSARAMAGRMTTSTANAMETAAGNSAGAMTGFMGMGMAMNGGGMGSGFNAAQGFYNQAAQEEQQKREQQMQEQKAAEAANSWKCSCGATSTAKFCPECGAPKPAPKPAQGVWKCACGAETSGKFCSECGAPKPAQDGWTCACGAFNKGKFCAECGAKKPAGIPQYKCDKCGWEPEDPTKAPKFCPECGDPFDSGDMV